MDAARKSMAKDSVMMTSGQVAALLHLSTNTVRHWNDRGLLQAYRIGSRRDRRFLRKDVEAAVGFGYPARDST
jgi:excisionase family DNA binding protein